MSRPRTIEEACSILASDPEASLLSGGTDYMVEVNFNHRKPTHVVSLRDVAEIARWSHDQDSSTVTIGAGVTMATIEGTELARLLPALAQAARTVGSPQIRAAATIGGNLGTASPAGDTLPVLSALDAVVEVASASARREVSIHDYFLGPKRTLLQPGEMIVGIRVPRADGPQHYAKVGVRNAMVISIASACLAVQAGSTRVALGSVGPTVIRCRDAEAFLDRSLASGSTDASVIEEFARLVGRDARPIDDHRSTAAYRRHAIGVLAHRLAQRSLPHVH